jgi:hypothetical protein
MHDVMIMVRTTLGLCLSDFTGSLHSLRTRMRRWQLLERASLALMILIPDSLGAGSLHRCGVRILPRRPGQVIEF